MIPWWTSTRFYIYTRCFSSECTENLHIKHIMHVAKIMAALCTAHLSLRVYYSGWERLPDKTPIMHCGWAAQGHRRFSVDSDTLTLMSMFHALSVESYLTSIKNYETGNIWTHLWLICSVCLWIVCICVYPYTVWRITLWILKYH